MKKHTTREGWLAEAVALLDGEFFNGHGYTLPSKLSISCGFPRGGRRAIGQCWDPKVTKDGTVHIFICPTQGDAMHVLDITLHELIHAAVGLKEKHRGKFKALAKEFGLQGKMTSTFVEPGSQLHRRLASIYTTLGDYPHDAIVNKIMPKDGDGGDGDGGDGEGEDKGRKPWPVYVSTKEPKFKVYTSPTVIKQFGVPKDPWGVDMVEKGAETTEEPTDPRDIEHELEGLEE